jgi:protein SCO1
MRRDYFGVLICWAVFSQAAAWPAAAHGAHKHAVEAEAPAPFRRTSGGYTVPSVSLVRQDGATVAMQAEIDPQRPVFVNFVFTTCASICPMMTQTFAGLQD